MKSPDTVSDAPSASSSAPDDVASPSVSAPTVAYAAKEMVAFPVTTADPAHVAPDANTTLPPLTSSVMSAGREEVSVNVPDPVFTRRPCTPAAAVKVWSILMS